MARRTFQLQLFGSIVLDDPDHPPRHDYPPPPPPPPRRPPRHPGHPPRHPDHPSQPPPPPPRDRCMRPPSPQRGGRSGGFGGRAMPIVPSNSSLSSLGVCGYRLADFPRIQWLLRGMCYSYDLGYDANNVVSNYYHRFLEEFGSGDDSSGVSDDNDA